MKIIHFGFLFSCIFLVVTVPFIYDFGQIILKLLYCLLKIYYFRGKFHFDLKKNCKIQFSIEKNNVNFKILEKINGDKFLPLNFIQSI